MKQITRYTLALMALLMVCTGAWAEVVIKPTANGTVVKSVSGSTVTLTVTPDNDYYLSTLKVTKTVDGSNAQTRNDPAFNPEVELTATDANADLGGVTTWTFTTEDPYGYEVASTFEAQTSIATATITVDGTYTYTGEAIEPTFTVDLGGTALTKGTDFTVAYENNTNAQTSNANNAPTITLTGKSKYTGTVSTTFAIGKADPTLTFSPTVATYTFGTTFTKPTLTKKPTDATVTYTSSKTDVATVDASTGDITGVAAGEATITVTFAGNDNYNEGTGSYTLTVAKGAASVSKAPTAKENLVYTGEAQALINAGEATNGEMKYKVGSDGTYSTDIPKETGAKEYTIYYKAVASDATKYTDSEEGSLKVTIAKAEAGLKYSKDKVEIEIDEEWKQPELTNPNKLKIEYKSSDTKVATIDDKGKVEIKGKGKTTISAIFKGDDNYEAQTVSYALTVKESYLLWVDGTQVTTANSSDILKDGGHFFFDIEENMLVITENKKTVKVESSMKELIIFINGNNKLDRIVFKESEDVKTGSLKLTAFNNIPGKLTLSTSDANGVISGFSSLTIDEEALLFLLDPEEGTYANGSLKNAEGSTAMEAAIGQYIKPLVNNKTVTFPSSLTEDDLGNMIVDDVLLNLVQHAEDTDADDDYYEQATGAIVLNNVNSTSDIKILSESVESGDLLPGTNEYAETYNGVITFIVPDGEGKIILNVETEAGYKLMLQVGNNTAEGIVQDERGDVTIDYNVEKPTYCWLYLVKADGTRIGKREKVHGKVYSIKVQPSRSTSNPLGDIGGFPASATPEVVTGNTTGIVEIKHDVITDSNGSEANNQWYDLQGRKIEKPVKPGIYIQNHKKVLIK